MVKVTRCPPRACIGYGWGAPGYPGGSATEALFLATADVSLPVQIANGMSYGNRKLSLITENRLNKHVHAQARKENGK